MGPSAARSSSIDGGSSRILSSPYSRFDVSIVVTFRFLLKSPTLWMLLASADNDEGAFDILRRASNVVDVVGNEVDDETNDEATPPGRRGRNARRAVAGDDDDDDSAEHNAGEKGESRKRRSNGAIVNES